MNTKKILLLLAISISVVSFTPVESVPPPDDKIEELIKTLETTQENPEKVNILKDLCWQYRKINQEKAIEFGTMGLRLAQKINFQEGVAKCLNNIGIVYFDEGDYKKALEMLLLLLLGLLFYSNHQILLLSYYYHMKLIMQLPLIRRLIFS